MTDPPIHGARGDERIRTADRAGTIDVCTSRVSPANGGRRGYVYFLQDGFNTDGAIKIGFSSDPVARLAYINRRLNSPSLKMLAALPATFDVERELHQRWDEYRVIGEWFRPAFKILDAIDLINLLHPLARAAELATTRQALTELQDKHDHLRSEWGYEAPRGDHLVYAREWDEFNEWQRTGKKLLPRAHDALDDAIKAAVNGDWSQEDYDEWDAVRRALAATEEPA